jgi:hypothetical protein
MTANEQEVQDYKAGQGVNSGNCDGKSQIGTVHVKEAELDQLTRVLDAVLTKTAEEFAKILNAELSQLAEEPVEPESDGLPALTPGPVTPKQLSEIERVRWLNQRRYYKPILAKRKHIKGPLG